MTIIVVVYLSLFISLIKIQSNKVDINNGVMHLKRGKSFYVLTKKHPADA